MGRFSQEEFNEFILKNNIIGFFNEPVTLKSGRKSNWYVNWRKATDDVFLLERLADYIIEFTEDLGLEPDCFYGVPEGATKTGIITQYKWAKRSPDYGPGSHSLPMGRGKSKEYGLPENRHFIGKPKGKTIVIEDVTTTGGSLIETIDKLNGADVDVIAAFGLTNRMELRDDGLSVREAVEAKGVPYYAMSDALSLLPIAYRRLGDAIEEEFERYGVEKLKLR